MSQPKSDTISESSIARMAGNIAGSLIAQFGSGPDVHPVIAERAVTIARAIAAEMERTRPVSEPETSLPSGIYRGKSTSIFAPPAHPVCFVEGCGCVATHGNRCESHSLGALLRKAAERLRAEKVPAADPVRPARDETREP